MMRIQQVGNAIGNGLFAGLMGTAAMTLSSTLEMKLRNRGPSSTPAEGICRMLDIRAVDDEAQQRLNTLIHWGYGTVWGGVRGLLDAMGLRGGVATAAHFALIWGAQQIMIAKLQISPPLTEWPPEEVAIDGWHHLVYAQGTGIAYDRLNPSK